MDRIWHFMRDGAKEFFVKRMPKEFGSEFNMPASMFRDHLIIFENLWSHGQDYMKGQPSSWMRRGFKIWWMLFALGALQWVCKQALSSWHMSR